MTDHIDAARKVLLAHRASFAAYDIESVATLLVAALDRAGLLRTDLHERALAACEDGHINGIDLKTIHSIGRESLTPKQPKPRWTINEHCGSDVLKDGRWTARFNSDEDARAYAEHKNAEASK